MDQADKNPSTNQLGPSLTEDQVRDAVTKSGYPLQNVVGDLLRSKQLPAKRILRVEDEWSYVDQDSNQLRSIDVLAELQMYDWEPQPRVRPYMNLLIEWKQSELPFIFFESGGRRWLGDFPTVAGLARDKVVIISDDDPSTWTFTIPHVLGLDSDEFLSTAPLCFTLSKCERKGKDIVLSGADAYNSIVLPLVKAQKHFVQAEKPPSTAWYFDFHAVLAVAVVDAPMLSVKGTDPEPRISATPWVRVLRHEYEQHLDRFDCDQIRVVDVVHKDFFDRYLDENVLPFGDRLATKVLGHPTELATGAAYVPRMGADGWREMEPRLQPRPPVRKLTRARAIGRNIVDVLSGRGRP